MVEAVSWYENNLQLIDQTLLPDKSVYIQLDSIEGAFEAIRNLRVRGAPAIGITAAYGLYLGMRPLSGITRAAFFEKLDNHIAYLSTARPTAVNLFWALQSLKSDLKKHPTESIEDLKDHLLSLAIALHNDDRQRCRDMADHGQAVVPSNAKILTHCNTGALATGGIGTALGVIYRAHELQKNIQVYADETRPVLQGARLTVWELVEADIPVNLICDSMAASLMQQNGVDLIIVGADRIAADGSAANKIGTYGLAVLAKYHNVPFYVAAPLSTFDMAITEGKNIPIEIRNSDEIRNVFSKCMISVPDVDCWNPAFDVTPPDLITGIITEKGIIQRPYRENIKQLFEA